MRLFYALICFLILTTCSKNSVNDENCQFLLEIGINETINLGLPEFGNLRTSPGAMLIPSARNRGLIVSNTGNNNFVAFDAADPNHIFNPSCSVLTVKGFTGVCGCEEKNEFELINGLPTKSNSDETSTRCGLRRYRVEKSGNSLIIFN
ncbi:hypothetical protein [Algibacter sp. 2305UL17-15]|uniref:hypothetical protein n=1 Tax=Algibacter sp. 2305UL17-15 TaxID=3231268 RepID=UPI00345B1ED5